MQNEKKNKKQPDRKRNNAEGHVEKPQMNEESGKQQYTEDNISEEYTQAQQEEEENPWHVRRNVVEGYVGQDDDEHEEENLWHVRGNVIEDYVDQDDDEHEEENPWHVRGNVVESYVDQDDEEETDDRQWLIRKSSYDREEDEEDRTDKHGRIVDDDDVQDEEDEGQSEATNQRPGLASHFNFIHRAQDRYSGVVAPEEEEAQQQPSQSGFLGHIWNHYKEYIIPTGGRSQEASHFNFVSLLLNQYKEFVAAASFLTTLPFAGISRRAKEEPTVGTPASTPDESGSTSLRFGSAYFPLVGLVIALIICVILIIGLAVRLPALVLAALVIVAQAWLTGGLHLDGLMDTCDGIFDRGTRERKLEIMHDSCSGAFGVIGGICILLFKFALFASMNPHRLALALLIVLPLARWGVVLAMYIFPNALLTGLGAAARQTVTRPRILIAGVTSLLIALIVGQLTGLTAWIVGSLVTLIIGIWVTYILSGLTGDIYGTIVELTEVAGLLVLVGMR